MKAGTIAILAIIFALALGLAASLILAGEVALTSLVYEHRGEPHG